MNDDLDETALVFLSKAEGDGILAFRPHKDPMIVALLERGYLEERDDVDPAYRILVLTASGRAAVARARAGKAEA